MHAVFFLVEMFVVPNWPLGVLLFSQGWQKTSEFIVLTSLQLVKAISRMIFAKQGYFHWEFSLP